MKPLTDSVPKALIEVRGVPFAHYQLSWLRDQGIKDVVYSIGYRGGQIASSIGDGRAWGLRVRYVDEGESLLGTGGAIRLAAERGVLDPAFFVLYGDSFLPISFGPVWKAWEGSGRPALMTVLRNRGHWDQSNCVYRDGGVELYDKHDASGRRQEMEYIDYGLSILSRSEIESKIPSGRTHHLPDYYHEESLAGNLAGFEVSERFFEVGSPLGLADFSRWSETEL
jgi:NDP-sugar pyrophosphorylase family protein